MPLALANFEIDLKDFDYERFKEDTVISRDIANNIFDRRGEMFKAAERGDETGVKDNYNICLNECNRALKMNYNYLPWDSIKEREEYAKLIRKDIDERILAYNLGGMTAHLGRVIKYTIDYLMGPIILRFIIEKSEPLKNNVRSLKNSIEREQKRGIMSLVSYFLTYEMDRIRNAQEFERDKIKPRKVFAKGRVLLENDTPTGGVKTLIFNLFDIVEPTLHLLGKSEEGIYQSRAIVEKNFEKYIEKRRELSRREKILLEDEEVRELILQEIKPKTIYDLIKSHPLPLKLEYKKIRARKPLAKRKEGLVDCYLEFRGPSSFCCQAEIYGIDFDILFGSDGDQLVAINIILNALGYRPLPVFPPQREFLSEIKFYPKVPILKPQEYLKINPLSYMREMFSDKPPTTMYV
jgi:hypothetical protein